MSTSPAEPCPQHCVIPNAPTGATKERQGSTVSLDFTPLPTTLCVGWSGNGNQRLRDLTH